MTNLEWARDVDIIEDFIMARATVEDWNGPDEASPLKALNRLQGLIAAHLKEAAVRDEDMRMNFEVAEKALRERDRLEAELATLRAAVRECIDRAYFDLPRLRQLIEEKP